MEDQKDSNKAQAQIYDGVPGIKGPILLRDKPEDKVGQWIARDEIVDVGEDAPVGDGCDDKIEKEDDEFAEIKSRSGSHIGFYIKERED